MQDYERIHLEPEFDCRTRRGSGGQDHVAFGINVDTTEPVDVGSQVALAESILPQFDEKTITTTSDDIVPVFLVGGITPLRSRLPGYRCLRRRHASPGYR